MINWLIDNFQGIIIATLMITGLGCGIYLYLNNTNNRQKETILTWLLHVVVEAERLFGSKSGQLKLSYVYNLYITRFPIVSKIIPKKVFLLLVDEALDQMRELIEKSLTVYNYVKDDAI